jgi:hypothetical protein
VKIPPQARDILPESLDRVGQIPGATIRAGTVSTVMKNYGLWGHVGRPLQQFLTILE